jgi:hypothetical protein
MNKEGPKNRNFQQLFGNCTTTKKPVYMPMELILNSKKAFLTCLRFLKKSVLNLLDHTVYMCVCMCIYIIIWLCDTHTLPVLNDFLSPVLHFDWQIFNHSVYKGIKDKRPVLRCNFCSTHWASILLFLPFYNARMAEGMSTVQCRGLWT